MGLIDFVTGAGAALFGGGKESDQERSAKLNHVRMMHLPVTQLRIDVAGATATVHGEAATGADGRRCS